MNKYIKHLVMNWIVAFHALTDENSRKYYKL